MKNSENRNVTGVILKTVRQHLILSLGIVCAVAGAIVMALLPPWILGMVIDGLTEGQKLPMALVIFYFLFLALTGITESTREGLLTGFGQKITHALRSSLMDKYTRLSTDELTAQEPGTIVSRFVGDVDTVENLFTSGIVSMFADACKIISILAVIWFRTRGLAIVLLALLPFLFWFTRNVQKHMLRAQIANRKAVGRASGYVPETIHNIRTIHCLAKENYMESRYDDAIVDSFRAVEKTNFYDAIYSPVILILNAVVVAVVMLFSASGNPTVLTLFGMSAGTAVAVINYISQIFTPVESLGMEIQTIQSAIAGVHRVNEFFQLPERREEISSEKAEKKRQESSAMQEEQTVTEGREYVPAEPDCVQFEHVTFSYDKAAEHDILKDLSFSVKEGEQVTLSGRTGAGKSTIFKLLLGLYEPKQGSVFINGIPVTEISDADRRRMFGYVEQTFHMVPGSVRDQITLYDPSITMEAVEKAAETVGLASVIRQLPQGYDTSCTSELFSQGQWQLMSIARATAADPKLLLLDEITANLDAQTEKEVLLALQKSAVNRTVISISHRVNARTGRVIHLSQEDSHFCKG